MFSALLVIICAYLMTSIPTGYWLVKALKGIDIRTYGSGSTGATNVWRCAGRTAGLTVFFADVLKGYLPVAGSVYLDNFLYLSTWNFVYPHLIPAIVAGAALVGHSRSIFLKFQGGKSAATGLGTLLALSPMGGLLTFITWIAVVKTTRWVSLASILGVGSCPFWFKLFGAPTASIGYCVFGFIYVTYRHKANIKRMFNGTEPKVGDKPKDLGAGEPNGDQSENVVAPKPDGNERQAFVADSEPLPNVTVDTTSSATE